MKGLVTSLLLHLFAAALLCVSPAYAYFRVTQPTASSQWVNGGVNIVAWDKGSNDGLNAFDLKLVRTSAIGLVQLGSYVPAAPGAVNVELDGMPPGNDYALVFLNSTTSHVYGRSEEFTILESGAVADTSSSSGEGVEGYDKKLLAAATKAAKKAETITATEGPHPTAGWAREFPVLENGARRALSSTPGGLLGAAGAVVVMGACMVLV